MKQAKQHEIDSLKAAGKHEEAAIRQAKQHEIDALTAAGRYGDGFIPPIVFGKLNY
jgi:hypothetical protein